MGHLLLGSHSPWSSPLAKAPRSELVRSPPRWRSTTCKEGESGLGALSPPHPTPLASPEQGSQSPGNKTEKP